MMAFSSAAAMVEVVAFTTSAAAMEVAAAPEVAADEVRDAYGKILVIILRTQLRQKKD